MSTHGLSGAAEVAVKPGLQVAHQIPSGRTGERPAAERGTSGGANVDRPFRYRDLGLVA